MYQPLTIPKSKIALANAFVSLLRHKNYDQITVQDICQEANVGRSTFYHHFNDKNDALKDLVNRVSHLAKNTALDSFLTDDQMDLQANLIRIYKTTIRYHKFIQALLSIQVPDANFEANIEQMLRIKIETMIVENQLVLHIPKELAISLYISNAILVTKYIAFHPETSNITELAAFMGDIYQKLLGQIESPLHQEDSVLLEEQL